MKSRNSQYLLLDYMHINNTTEHVKKSQSGKPTYIYVVLESTMMVL